jgi:transposase
LAYVDQGYAGDAPAEDAATHGIMLEVVKLSEAKRRFVLLPRRWVVERSISWMRRFGRLAKDYERLPATIAGLHSSPSPGSSSVALSNCSPPVHNTL